MRLQGALGKPRRTGTPERIRTSDLRLRRPLLYPTELRALESVRSVPEARRAGIWSGWRDSNPRHSAPKADALPGCATPRMFFPKSLSQTCRLQPSTNLNHSKSARRPQEKTRSALAIPMRILRIPRPQSPIGHRPSTIGHFVCYASTRSRCSRNLSSAFPLWLMRFFSSRGISAVVRPRPGCRNRGS